MTKKSTMMIYITISLLVLVSINSFMVLFLSKIINKDAEIINLTGVIRGSIQRIAKLELTNNNSDYIIMNVDQILSDFNTKRINMGNNSFYQSLLTIEKEWKDFKDNILIYRSKPNFVNQKNFLYKSEQLWLMTNSAVFNAQKISEKRVGYFNYIIYYFFLNIFLLAAIFMLIRKYVINSLEYSVSHDFLTGIYNRSFYYEYLLKEIEKSKRLEYTFSLIILDIDYFKIINDKYGHDVGDLILKELSQVISKNIRKSDIFARIGGEEFALILSQTNQDSSVIFAEKIRKTVANNIFSRVGHLTISLGVTQFRKNDTIDAIYKRADLALYKSKQNGRNRVEME
ncbi:MAG: GGDEF domain-containing protein [Bacillota bacterium]